MSSNKPRSILTALVFFLFLISFSMAASIKWERVALQTYSDPIFDDTGVYIATVSGTIYKFDKKTGSQIWRIDIGSPIFVTPVLDVGALYIGSQTGVHAIDENGSIIGKYQTEGEVLTGPMISEGNLIVVASEKVYVFMNKNLDDPFIIDLPGKTQSASVMYAGKLYTILTNGDIYVVEPYVGTMTKLRSMAKTVWKSIPVIANGTLFFAAEETFYALKTTGLLTWKKDFDAWASSPIYREGRIYVGSNDGNLYALSAETGSILWKFKANDSVGKPVVTSHTIYVPSHDKNIYAVGLNGKKKWNLALDDWPSSPVISDGVLYAATFNGTVYAISTLDCQFTLPEKGARVSTPAILSGVASSDIGIKTVDIKSEIGNWTSATGKAEWEINYPVTGYGDGESVIFYCRTTDTDNNVEIDPYDSLSVQFVASEERLPWIHMKYPAKVTAGKSFTVDFMDEEGLPLKNITIVYGTERYSDKDGSLTLKAPSTGPIILEITKPNYKSERITIEVEPPKYDIYIIIGAAVVVIIIVVAFLYITKRWR